MKKPEWLFVGILILVGAYFTYKYFTKPEKFDAFQLVPNSAVAVYESPDIIATYSDLQQTDYWQDLTVIQELSDVESLMNAIDSLLNRHKQLGRLLKKNRTLFSVHVTGNESVGLMLYLPTGASSRKIFDGILAKPGGKLPNHQTRVYDKLTIHELSAGNRTLTYVIHKGYAIVSSVGYLVEDVVRNINNDFKDNFIANNPELLNVPKLTDDSGNLYINGTLLSDFYQTLIPALHDEVGLLAKSIFMDINLAKEQALFSGFLFEDKPSEFATLFRDQEAGFPTTIKLVPDNAALVMSINVSNVNTWHERWLSRFALPSAPQKNNDAARTFIKNAIGDITLATFSANDKSKRDKLLFLKLADKEGMLNVLNKQAEEIAQQNGDSVYFEQYATYNIGLIDKDDFVAGVLGSPYSGFPSTYFMIYDEYLVMASSAERIKKWLRDIEDDYVWGRSAEIRSFVDENLGEVSFALVFNNPWNWSLSLDAFNTKHKNWWQANEKSIKQFAMAAYQFTNLDNKFYTAASFNYEPLKVELGQQTLNDKLNVQLANSLIRKPKLVMNNTDGSWEILVQDSAYQLSLLGANGETMWSDSLSDAIISQIYKLDYFKNKKYQFLFATDSTIHIIDRNGDYVDGFPAHLKDVQIEQLFLLDYDHTKNYRFLVADNTGNLIMFDQQMVALEGWNPLAFNSTLSNQIFHVRVRGKDRILVAKRNGIIDLRNRRAEEQPGFPLDLQFNFYNPIHFSVGSTFESSMFTTLSREGMVVQFDLNGKIYAQNQLYQATSSSDFSLLIDAVQNDYIFTRQDLNRLVVLDKMGTVIFEKDYQTNSKKDIQYYSLGVDKQLFIIRDTESGKVYIYNKNGTLINSDVIISNYPISVVYRKSEAKCYIYTANQQLVEVKSFSF